MITFRENFEEKNPSRNERRQGFFAQIYLKIPYEKAATNFS